MSWIPGWESVAAAGWWSGFFFWASIVSLIGLGISEIASHRYSERKDELVAENQLIEKRQHDEQIAGLHLATAQANEEAAKARAEQERLKGLVIWRSISDDAANGLATRLSARKAKITLAMVSNDPEAFSLTAQLQPIFERAGWDTVPMSGWWGKWLPIGVHIYGSDEEILKLLCDSFAAENLQFSTDAPPSDPDLGLIVPGPRPAVTVLIGSRLGPFK
jgi:hypothetical protein